MRNINYPGVGSPVVYDGGTKRPVKQTRILYDYDPS